MQYNYQIIKYITKKLPFVMMQMQYDKIDVEMIDVEMTGDRRTGDRKKSTLQNEQ